MARLEQLVSMLRAESARQNLISAASLDQVWSRHVLDSTQLLRLAPTNSANWLDIGTGAGFPGLVIAMLHRSKITLVEPRRLRAAFLTRAAEQLGLTGHMRIICARIEKIDLPPVDVISARAFAPLGRILEVAHRFSRNETRWILPKGRNAKSELEAALSSWQGDFRLKPSLTDPDARIIVAERVRRKPKGKKAG